jgi:diguanylate cyclase (GGDEF)-like protein/PAS domain S-box-containing protein
MLPYDPVSDDIKSRDQLIAELRNIRQRFVDLEYVVEKFTETAELPAVQDVSYRTMVENTVSPLFILQEERFRFINPAGEYLLGRTLNQLVRIPITEWVHPDSETTFRELVGSPQPSQGRWNGYEIQVLTPDRGAIWLCFCAVPFQYNGFQAALVSAFDVTVRKQAEIISSVLYRISNAVATTHNLDELFATIHRTLKELIRAPNFFITLFHDEKIGMDFPYYRDDKLLDRPVITNIYDPVTRALTREVIRGRVPIFYRKADIAEFRADSGLELPDPLPEIWLGVPLMIRAEMAGAMGVLSVQDPHLYRESDMNLMVSVSEQIALAVERKMSQERMQRLATTDGLTGLYNRSQFLELARREIDRANRYMEPLSLLMIDLDLFKLVNDTYGHDVGDQVLVALARFLEKNLRDVDLVGRLGGEEFSVILPSTTLKRATQVAERIRRHLSETHIATTSGELRITTSIGVTALRGETRSVEALLKKADQGLYMAKQLGRNRVCPVD